MASCKSSQISSTKHGNPPPFSGVVPCKRKLQYDDSYFRGEYLTVKGLEGLGAPWMLANLVAEEAAGMWTRVFLLDNSGSTSKADGHVLQKDHLGRTSSVPATRWEEICATALEQAEWNLRAGTSTEFHLLNTGPGAGQEGRDFVKIPACGDLEQVCRLQAMLRRSGPHGTTPLASRLSQIRQRLLQADAADGRVMLTVITDGVPTGDSLHRAGPEDFVRQLRNFAADLNAFVVIRLATDDDAVVEYYNRIDEELELPMDILDDLKGEAEELHAHGNGWFAYTPILHRIREAGSLSKLFDLLDERALEVPEISTMLELLLRDPDDPPFPRRPEELLEVVVQKLAHAAPVFNARLDRMSDPVDLKLLKQALGLSPWQQIQKAVLSSFICRPKRLP